MLKHIVFFKMQAEAEGASAETNALQLKQMLDALPAVIPEIVALETGLDVSRSPASFDLSLYTEFASEQDLETYRVHPAHQKAVAFVQKVTSARAVVDYHA